MGVIFKNDVVIFLPDCMIKFREVISIKCIKFPCLFRFHVLLEDKQSLSMGEFDECDLYRHLCMVRHLILICSWVILCFIRLFYTPSSCLLRSSMFCRY